jgi:hypothetical protein
MIWSVGWTTRDYNAFGRFEDEIACLPAFCGCLTGERDRRCTSVLCNKICRSTRASSCVSVRCMLSVGKTRFPVLLPGAQIRSDSIAQCKHISDFLAQRRSQALQYLVCTRINSKIKHCSIWFSQDYLSMLRLAFIWRNVGTNERSSSSSMSSIN